MYVANRGEGSFTVFAGGDLEKIYSTKLGTGPGHVAVAPDRANVYINDEAEFKTYIFDPKKREVIHTIHLWPEPHETAFYIPKG